MKTILNKSRLICIMVLCFASSLYLTSCKKTIYPLLVNNLLNISSYIEADPSQYSLFYQMMVRTKAEGFLQAYGAYTVFVPNDDAVRLYMKSKGKTSVNDFPLDSLTQLVNYHIIQNDTISTNFFIDGKLRTPTMFGQYLTSGVVNVSGTSSYIINGQALILKSNVACGNGILHVIDHVLQPASQNIAQLIKNNPKYSIFYQALVRTGYYDTLNVAPANNPNRPGQLFTVFAQTDSVYLSIGIPTVDALQAKYSTVGSSPLRNPNDGFYNYVGYHILPENSYLTDILSKSSHLSITPGKDVISDVLQNQTIQLNYDLINGVQYPGASVDRQKSNIPATNGVLHSVAGDIFIKIFPPTRVDWDLADQPEFRKQSSIFRIAGKTAVSLPSPMINITWSTGGTVGYTCQAANNNSYFWWNDIITLNNFRTGSNLINDISFTTPVIIKGKYKVWICYQRSSETAAAQFYVDDQPLQNIIPALNGIYSNGTDSGPVLESKGIKRYTEAPVSTTSNAVYNNTFGLYLGVANITTTDRHILRAVAIGGNTANTTWDMVQFIPFDQDQQSPRYYRRDGTVTN
ncbi:fasciclin domain-containing protein [Mucilaginibacter sp. HMF5004]|uniref:fasciclin domain-containing protein n=1 Tax=Mucilaginibacter rivuli TaxID=2857527 RepID=UPI001C5D0C06|nr:fasciclin domain-containing protein [Mucilaginibacter rivuli]MBW4889145.1 fasciclin domain-containing protein [Mucilaginibacter rivuli]